MKINGLFLSFLCISLTCLSADSKVNISIDYLRKEVKDPAHSWPPCGVSILANFPNDVLGKLVSALEFIEDIRGDSSSPLHQKIFNGPVSAKTYCDFIKERVTYFSFGTPESCGFSYADACYNSRSKIVTITKALLNLSKLEIASVIIHEAYHADVPRHIYCPIPMKLAHKVACDDFFSGAYGTEIIWLKNIREYCTNCPPEIKTEALILKLKANERIIGNEAREELDKD